MNITIVHYVHISTHINLFSFELTLVRSGNHIWDFIVYQYLFLLISTHVAFRNFGAYLLFQNCSEFWHWNFVLCNKVFQKCSNFIYVNILEIIFCQQTIRKLYFLDLKVFNMLNGPWDEGTNRQIHQHVFKYIFETRVRVVCKLFN